MTTQHFITLAPFPRGVHLITDQITPYIRDIQQGIAHLFLQHTSASLALNENYDLSVRNDIEHFLRRLIPDGDPHFTHTLEGADDMPAHLKNIFIGSDLTLPITDGKLNLGTWQGIYLLEHRISGGNRKIILTLTGD